MTALLASVRCPEEAELALAGGADVIDLKDPARGALGALPCDVIEAAVARVAGRRPVSATAGDLPMDPLAVTEAVDRIAGTGVDFVKVGMFPGGDKHACLDALARRRVHLVAVLFADRAPDFGLVERVAERGFVGIMLDTAGKDSGNLRRHLSRETLGGFVAMAKDNDLFVGLAGSLAREDIAPLLELRPDYLGFRGALTAGGRNAPLDPDALAGIRAAIPRPAEPGQLLARAMVFEAAAPLTPARRD